MLQVKFLGYNAPNFMKTDASFFKGLISGVILTLAGFLIANALGPADFNPSPEKAVVAKTEKVEPVTESATDNLSPSKGPQDAPIRLTEYADFHCSFCKRAYPTMKKVFHEFSGKIYWTFHHFPLTNNPSAENFVTHEASACAQEQGHFWEFHDLIWEHPANPTRSDLDQFALRAGLDQAQYQECMTTHRQQDYLMKQRDSAIAAGIR